MTGPARRAGVVASLVAPLVLALAVLLHPARAAAAPREIVIANEALHAGGKHVPANLEAFVRRLESLAGWPKGSLKGKAFTTPREALDHIRKNKTPFAILPPHQFLEARKELKLDILARAVGVEGTDSAYWGVSRNEKQPYTHIEDYRGLRLAATETYDLQWLDVLFEDNLEPASHFKYVPVATSDEALAAVLAKKADVALLYQRDLDAIRHRIEGAGADLMTVYASATIPPPVVVAVGKYASKADRKKLADAMAKMCKGDGGDVCSRMAIRYIEVGRADTYKHIINKYETY